MKTRLLLLSLALGLLAGCTTGPTNTNTATVNATPSPTASPSPSPAQSASTTPAQITLPLLDALLGDEKFVQEARSKVRLTDEQINSLKRVSGEEIGRLREANAEDLDEMNGDVYTRANEQLNKILGEEKAREFATFANDYWATGGQTNGDSGPAVEMSKGPNAVPSDTRVVVNIPAFRMDVFQDGSLVKSYQVGIGYPDFPLPQGLRKAQQIIFNPTWTPPDEPWVAKMKGVRPGETVEAGSRENPLGPIKIPIGLPSLIHGGKAPAKIGKFASHGCVGLTNNQIKDFSMQLAKASGSDLSQQEIDKYLKNKTQTETVKLDQAVPVELRYETIVLEDDGKLHIYRDVYTQGTNTEENLRSVLEAHGMKLEDLAEDQRAKALGALTAKNQKEVVIDLKKSEKGYPVAVNLSRR
ncbi:MAG TPA: L,D-transpeptidase [Pyrinomonadaceae bacterium]|nr:L,D-transpeptidase [Pyrinomonadaceae bacterium]